MLEIKELLDLTKTIAAPLSRAGPTLGRCCPI